MPKLFTTPHLDRPTPATTTPTDLFRWRKEHGFSQRDAAFLLGWGLRPYQYQEAGTTRDGYRVLDEAGNEIGYVASGSYAPFLKKNIALAYVPVDRSAVDSVVAVEIRNQPVKCKVVPIPFYKRPKKSSN